MEVIVEPVPWQPRTQTLRRGDDDIVAVRIAWNEAELRERVERLGAVWRPAQKIGETSRGDEKRLGLGERVVEN